MHLLLQVGLACSLITACSTRVPDCTLVDCMPQDCLAQYTPYGQCCPICRTKQPCYYKGKVYKDGERFKDECNTCSCNNGSVPCTKIGCPGNPKTCTRNGIIYKEGESVPSLSSCEAGCVCRGGEVICLPTPCFPEDRDGLAR